MLNRHTVLGSQPNVYRGRGIVPLRKNGEPDRFRPMLFNVVHPVGRDIGFAQVGSGLYTSYPASNVEQHTLARKSLRGGAQT